MSDHFDAEQCDACHRTDCPDKHLCDISLDNLRPVPAANRAQALMEIADVWFGEQLAVDEDTLAELRSVAAMAMAEGKGRFSAHNELADMLGRGVTFADAALHLGVDVTIVVRQFTQTDETPVEAVLGAEARLRAGACSYAEVGRDVGMTRRSVLRLAETLGLSAAVADNLRAGGGYKYTAEQIRAGWLLKIEGQSFSEIAKRLGLKDKNAAVGMLRRNACPADIERHLGEVAA